MSGAVDFYGRPTAPPPLPPYDASAASAHYQADLH